MIQLTFSTDSKLHIISWNRKISDFSGKLPSEAVGYRYYEVFPRICCENADAISLAVRRKKKLSFKGYRFQCFHSYLDADVRISPVLSPSGEVRRVKISLSISSPCIHTVTLKDDDQNRDLEALASKVAHGIRNPLNAIKGCVVYINEKLEDRDGLGEFVKIMEDEIARLETFVSKSLSASFLKRASTDVNTLLMRIENITSPHFAAKDVRSLFEYGKIPLVMVNSLYLEQAILHVLRDAIDGVRSGGTLRVRTEVEAADWDGNGLDDSYVVIEVSNTGSGENIPLHLIQDSGCDVESRGFDLFVTNEMMKNCGGHLQISGNRYSGTTVRLLVPTSVGMG